MSMSNLRMMLSIKEKLSRSVMKPLIKSSFIRLNIKIFQKKPIIYMKQHQFNMQKCQQLSNNTTQLNQQLLPEDIHMFLKDKLWCPHPTQFKPLNIKQYKGQLFQNLPLERKSLTKDLFNTRRNLNIRHRLFTLSNLLNT